MKITWLGHSGFRIEIEQAVLLLDPWLTGNPMFPADRRAEALAGATHVLLTHAHGDHAGDALAIARDTAAPIVCEHELSTILGAEDGVQVLGFGKGGTVDLGGAAVTMVNAVHSSSIDFRKGTPGYGGTAAGFMIAGEGHTIYVSGDTDVTADMGVWAELHNPDIGLLACGGHYTMDMTRAAWAARKFFRFRTVIPSHYRTFPLLAQSAEVLKSGVGPGVRVIEPEVLVSITI